MNRQELEKEVDRWNSPEEPLGIYPKMWKGGSLFITTLEFYPSILEALLMLDYKREKNKVYLYGSPDNASNLINEAAVDRFGALHIEVIFSEQPIFMVKHFYLPEHFDRTIFLFFEPIESKDFDCTKGAIIQKVKSEANEIIRLR